MAEEKIIIVPKARPAVDFASNLLVIPKGDFDEYVKEIDKHHVEFIRSLEKSWAVTADGRAMEAVKMAKEMYEQIIRHHKYKRCLAMAKWCAAECVVNQDTYRRYLTHKSKFRIGHLRKWHKRWLELAEKFKHNKSTAQQGKG